MSDELGHLDRRDGRKEFPAPNSMAIITSTLVPVCDADGIIVERADPARVRRLLLAPNATVVRKRATPEQRKLGVRGEIVRINLASDGDDWLEISMRGDPRKYTFLEKTELMPYGVQALRYLPESTEALYRTVRTDCLKAA